MLNLQLAPPHLRAKWVSLEGSEIRGAARVALPTQPLWKPSDSKVAQRLQVPGCATIHRLHGGILPPDPHVRPFLETDRLCRPGKPPPTFAILRHARDAVLALSR